MTHSITPHPSIALRAALTEAEIDVSLNRLKKAAYVSPHDSSISSRAHGLVYRRSDGFVIGACPLDCLVIRQDVFTALLEAASISNTVDLMLIAGKTESEFTVEQAMTIARLHGLKNCGVPSVSRTLREEILRLTGRSICF